MTALRLTAVLTLLLVAPALAGDLVDQLPAGTLVHLEFSGLDDLGERLEGSRAQQLWNEPELQAFLAPALDGLREDLTFLMRESDEALRDMVLGDERPGRVGLSLVHFDGQPDDEHFELGMVASLALGERTEAIFQAFSERLEEQNPDEYQGLTRAGRPAFRMVQPEGEDDRVRFEVAQDEARLVMSLSLNAALPDVLGEAPATSLADSSTYQRVRQDLGEGEPLFLAFVDVESCLDVLMGMIDSTEDEPQTKVMMRSMLESPTYAAMKGMGWALTRDGDELVDRIAIWTPEGPDAMGPVGPLGDTVTRHAALADPAADLFYSAWFDLAEMRARSADEVQRMRRLYEDLGEEPPEALLDQADVFSMLGETLEDATGLDVLGMLEPTLGQHMSLFASAPPSTLSMPDAGLVLDLADPEGFDEALDVIVLMDDRIEEVNFSRQEHEGHELLTVKLVGAGLPLLPTLTRIDDQLLVTTTALSMKNLLSGLGAGGHLAADERFSAFADGTAPEDALAIWVDVGACFRYLYGFVGMGLGMARSADADLSDRFDASLLPTGDLLANHLGLGSIRGRTHEQGWIYEGRSTLANPALGVVGGLGGVAALIAASAGSQEAARDARQEQTEEHLLELARAMEAYRTSVGGGNYPDDLIKLVDRGLLTDETLLVDASDPRPKRTRTARGDRLPVSYTLASVAALPADQRQEFGEGAEHLLVTRGPWYELSRFVTDADGEWEFKQGEARLAVVLGDEQRTLLVLEEEWGG